MNTLDGQQLGQYELISLLGEGGMASVYRAYQPSTQRDVAIKILKPNLTTDDVLVRRFSREAKTGIALDHPNIVKAFDYGQQGDLLYLVMELMTGGNLNSLIHQEHLQLPRFIQILEQVAMALDYAHGQSVVHRDIKPLNILFDTQGAAHVADFGIARILTETTIVGPVETTTGTRPYMAPEQWFLNFIDAQTDIYAFGVTAFEMLAAALPFTGPALSDAILKSKPLIPLSIRQFRPEMPFTLDAVFRRAMARDREDRYLTAAAFVEAMKQAASAFDSQRITPQAATPAAAATFDAANPCIDPAATAVPTQAKAAATLAAGATEEAPVVMARPHSPGGPGPAVNLVGDPVNGLNIYTDKCQKCHGDQGATGAANAGSDDGTIPVLNPVDQTLMSADHYVFVCNLDLFIEHGSVPSGPSPAQTMAPWGDSGQLKPQEIADVIEYVISLNPIATEAATPAK